MYIKNKNVNLQTLIIIQHKHIILEPHILQMCQALP